MKGRKLLMSIRCTTRTGSFAIRCGRLSRVTLSLRFPDLRRYDLSGRALADIPQNIYTTGLRAARPIKQVMCRCRVRYALLNQSNKNEVIYVLADPSIK